MAAAKKKQPQNTLDYEQTFERLNHIVEQLENADLPLEEALKQFEEGIKLTTQCQASLRQAEQKVQVIMQEQQTLLSAENSSET